jgi:DnaJ homolog subfamily C member 28
MHGALLYHGSGYHTAYTSPSKAEILLRRSTKQETCVIIHNKEAAMNETEQPEPNEDHPLKRVSGQRFANLIDQHIAEAQRAGLFDNLPGSGKPLNLDDDSMVPEEDRVGHRMLKNAGLAPAWIELQKEIREQQASLERWVAQAQERWPRSGPREREQIRQEHSQKVNALNKLITTYNLNAPPVAGQIPLLQLWREQRNLG